MPEEQDFVADVLDNRKLVQLSQNRGDVMISKFQLFLND